MLLARSVLGYSWGTITWLAPFARRSMHRYYYPGGYLVALLARQKRAHFNGYYVLERSTALRKSLEHLIDLPLDLGGISSSRPRKVGAVVGTGSGSLGPHFLTYFTYATIFLGCRNMYVGLNCPHNLPPHMYTLWL